MLKFPGWHGAYACIMLTNSCDSCNKFRYTKDNLITTVLFLHSFDTHFMQTG